MVSQDQSKDSGSKKNGGKELGMVTQEKSSKKMKFVSSAETETTSTTTISEDSNEMQSYIGVLARSRVPLVDKK
ncbi:unnamed protein product [Prunus brigantina]